jgi:hypothetical protein
MEGVISVLPTHKLKLHTTRSWDFMGFTKGRLGTPIEGDVIIGLLDTGYYLKHTIATILHCINNQANAQILKFFFHICCVLVLQESGQNLKASTI